MFGKLNRVELNVGSCFESYLKNRFFSHRLLANETKVINRVEKYAGNWYWVHYFFL
jgi:hypothetical protein